MLKDTITEIRAEAKRLGVPWSWVRRHAAELLEQEKERRERGNAIRRYAWEHHVGPASGSAPFWRRGFEARFGRRLANGADYTCIPDYDLIGMWVVDAFPEFEGDHAGDVSGCERLWAFLLTPYETLPPREQFYWEALNEIAEHQARGACCAATVACDEDF